MLQTLRKQSKKRILLKLKFKDFIKYQLWQYLIVFGSLALCAWFFDRWIESIELCIAHVCIRHAFNKQFHFNKTAYCLTLTLALIWFTIPIVLPIGVSLLSGIPIAFIICYIGFIVQDRVDIKRSLQHKSIYAMSAEELYTHCRQCGLGEEDCQIAKLIIIDRLKGQELYTAIGYSERQTKRKRTKILNTIK